MPILADKIKLAGVNRAAASAGVSRQHLYLCCLGQRKMNKRVEAAIAKYVTFYAAAPELKQRICNSK